MRLVRAGILIALSILSCHSALAQQRPLVSYDPRIIPDRAVDVRVGFALEQRAVYPISGVEGPHTSLFPAAVYLGVGDRAEFQFEGTVQDYVKDAAGTWRHDFGDLAISSKVSLFEESAARPAITFRNSIILPNANQGSGLGLNTLRFFSSVLAGKSAGRAYLYGGAGIGILEDATTVAAQQDVIIGNIATRIAISPNVAATAEFNAMRNPRNSPSLGSESRAEVRLGTRFVAQGMTWNVAALHGFTRVDPRAGFEVSVTRRFTLPGK